jgi:hypothetical protein
MMISKPFAELRQLLKDLGFSEARSESALVFRHPREGLLVFRRYELDEPVDEHDLVSARVFLDGRGLLDGKEFDGFLRRTGTPA